jgi:hypothetical protein
MIRIIGDTIELHGHPVATITAPVGTLRAAFEALLDVADRDVDAELAGAREDGYRDGYDAGRRDAQRETAA